MTNIQTRPFAKLFYSYSHRDMRFRRDMETSLALLRREALLEEWSDQQILPGRPIPPAIRTEMQQADIIVFLLSPDFIGSDECMKEWEYARDLASSGKLLFRIPIIIRPCSWSDLLLASKDEGDYVKVLPDDGKAITDFSSQDTGWQQVYLGLKSVIEELRNTFRPKRTFLSNIDSTEFVAKQNIKLQDIFVFLRLTQDDPISPPIDSRAETVSNSETLLSHKQVLIHGHENTGKTSLTRYLYMSLIETAQPVLLLDLSQSNVTASENYLRDLYNAQFTGDYAIWVNQPNKTLILDNLSEHAALLNFIEFAQDLFDRIVVTTSTDHFYSYFLDEVRLSTFRKMKIEPLTRSQQQNLIRRRLELLEDGEPVTDGFVDRVEDHVNSVIISDRVVPRYPFYVLSIVQVQEKGFPTDMMSITSYGHCYYALILAHFARIGISNNQLDSALNLAEHLAFAIYKHNEAGNAADFDFDEFLHEYSRQFIHSNSTVNRLRHPNYGIIGRDGTFRYRFMHYFFLGRFLARGSESGQEIINMMCENTHLEANYLTLLFTIHHANDEEIIDDILIRTMYTLHHIEPATLSVEDTRRFANIVNELPHEILSRNSVEVERERERARQDVIESYGEENDEAPSEAIGNQGPSGETKDENIGGAIFRILKNNKIMGQILRNKYGSLEIGKIEEVVEIISDGGLRLINTLLMDEEELIDIARHLHEEHQDVDIENIQRFLEFWSFFWTVANLQEIVNAVNVPEIRSAINSVVRRSKTPAYDLIGYFSLLDRAYELTDTECEKLADLLRAYEEDPFIQRVLSLRTQQYMNTHRSRATVEQKVCSLLNIRYIHRPAIAS